MPEGNKEQIDKEVKLLLENWGTEDGGFILGDYGDHKAIGADKKIKNYMLNKFQEEDPYRGFNI